MATSGVVFNPGPVTIRDVRPGGCASVLDRTMQDRLSQSMLRSYRSAVSRVESMPSGTAAERQAVEAQLRYEHKL